MEVMFSDILNYLNVVYIFICNIITYVIITCIPKDLSTGWKRTISTIVAIIAGILFLTVWHENHETIFCSFFVQYLMYDYVIKGFFKKLATLPEETATPIDEPDEHIEEPIQKEEQIKNEEPVIEQPKSVKHNDDEDDWVVI